MSFSFTPQQQQPHQSPFSSFLQPQQQSSPFQQQQQQQQSSPFQSQQPQQQPSPFQPQQQQQSSLFPQQQQQQSPFQLQPQPQQQQQQQQQQQPQQQLYLFTKDKVPATYSTKWADLHPDSQKVLLRIEETILEYRGESQQLDQCSRLYDSSVSNNGLELDSSYIVKELGGVSLATERQKSTIQELMTVVKEMLRNTEVAVRSFMMLRPRFLHQNIAGSSVGPTAPSQPPGAIGTQTSSSQAAANSMVVYDFYSGLPTKPSPFMQQTVARFEKYLSECRQWIEELEQLLILDSEKNSMNRSSSLLQSLPKVLGNVHGFFVHVAAKVESIHQYIESMKTAYLADQRHRGEGNNPFLEADRRETAKQEAAARRVHPTIHLPSVSQPTNQNTGQLAISAPPGPSMATNTSAAAAPPASLFSTPTAAPSASLFSTPSAVPSASLFSTPASAPSASLFSTPTAAPSAATGFGSSLFSTPAAPSATPSLFSTPTTSTPFPSLSNNSATPQPSPFSSTPMFGSTPASGVSSFSTPFGTGAATGSGASFGTQNKARGKSRTGRR